MNKIYVILILLFLNLSAAHVAGQNHSASHNTVYAVDTVKSIVAWQCGIHNGTIFLQSGRINFADNKMAGGVFKIKMDSIKDLDITYQLMKKTLENTLRSKDFLNTAKYRYADFAVDHVNYRNDSAVITGDLTFLGVTKCISFPAKVYTKNDSVFAKTKKITIDRTDFGNTAMSKDHVKSDKSFIVPDEVYIVIELKGYKMP